MADDVPSGHRVLLPADTTGSLMVFVNSRQVHEGVDFDVVDGALVFREALNVGRKTGFLGRLQMITAGVGVYEMIDKVDVHVTGPDGSFRILSELNAELDS